MYLFATITWLFVLKATALRVAYPFGALAFFIVLVLAHLLPGESIKWNSFAVAALIGYYVHSMVIWMTRVRNGPQASARKKILFSRSTDHHYVAVIL